MKNWKRRSGPGGGLEFWRPGPSGVDISVWQPRTKERDGELYWYICLGVGIVLRTPRDSGRYPDVFEAISTADALAAKGAFDDYPLRRITLKLSITRLAET